MGIGKTAKTVGRHAVCLLAVGLLACVGGAANGQEQPRQQAETVPAELGDMRVERVVRRPMRLCVARVMEGSVMTCETGGLLSHPAGTVKVGGRFPDSDYVLTRTMPRTVTMYRITKEVGEYTVSNVQTGVEFTIRKEQETESPDAYAFIRSSVETLQVEIGGKFIHPAGSHIKYQAVTIRREGVVLRRLSDGREFKLPTPAASAP